MLEDATPEQLKSFLMEQFDELKTEMPELYKTMECELYEHIYGPHFTSWKYDKAVSKLVNEDGTYGPHWSFEDVQNVIRSRGIAIEGYNDYDIAYVLNMLYSDYYGSVPDSLDTYIKMTKAFLTDKDASKGKAWLYWKAMK